jgi:hypothetical protein
MCGAPSGVIKSAQASTVRGGGETCAASTTNVRWADTAVTYEINTDGYNGTPTGFVAGVDAAFDAWNTVGTDWQANPSKNKGVAHASSLDNVMDGRNSVTWEPLPSTYAGAIAVTFTWRSTITGIIAEVDTVNNNALPWTQNNSGLNPESDLGDLSAFDVQNIMAHEVGHWLLLNHVNLSDHTMYTYGSLGEIQKRSLACGDIAGIEQMYPSGDGGTADVPGYCKRHPERAGCP